jgi:hypothetical protein
VRVYCVREQKNGWKAYWRFKGGQKERDVENRIGRGRIISIETRQKNRKGKRTDREQRRIENQAGTHKIGQRKGHMNRGQIRRIQRMVQAEEI